MIDLDVESDATRVAVQEAEPLTTADVKRRYSWGMAPHKSIPGGMCTVAAAAADFDRWLTAHDAEVRAEERAKLQDRIEELEKNLSYEVEQKIKLADTLRDERAKRPNREQIAHALWAHDGGSLCRAPICRYNDDDADADYECQCRRCWAIALAMADAALALEPETRTRTEWGVAYRQGDGSLFVDEAVNREDAESRIGWEGATCDFVVSRQVTDYRPVGDEPEAREEAEYFRDGDGDLWKFTDKGEWFHEEEPGEFRQVLSIDAEDQTLTPVGHAELAPAPEVTDADVEAAARKVFEYDAPAHEPDEWFGLSEPLRYDYRGTARAAREVSRG